MKKPLNLLLLTAHQCNEIEQKRHDNYPWWNSNYRMVSFFSLLSFHYSFHTKISSDDTKSTSPNLIQKFFLRQCSPKTRPYPSNLQVKILINDLHRRRNLCNLVGWKSFSHRNTDEHYKVSSIHLFFFTSDDEEEENLSVRWFSRRLINSNTPSTAKSSWASSLSSTNSKHNVLNEDETLHLSTTKKVLSKSQQSELNSYLSKRRNTTGSISLNKIVDLKNTSSGNALLLAAVNALNHSNQRITTESNQMRCFSFSMKIPRFSCHFFVLWRRSLSKHWRIRSIINQTIDPK